MSLKEDIVVHLKKFQSAPFLFVGSGLSRRYLNLENWDGLLRRFTQYGQIPFEYYYTKSNEDLPKVASLLADDFHETWWKTDQFKDKIEANKTNLKKKDSPLKIEISEYIKICSSNYTSNDIFSRELELFRKANVDGIITTNWDLLLEELFPNFEVFIGQERLLFSQPQTIAEIYKIHGCCTDPNSLVLTSEDYGLFYKRNSYLAAKLLTVFIEHPVLFMGYSLSDKNVLQILNSIASCLTNDNFEKLKNHLIFVEWSKDAPENNMLSRIITTNEGINLPVTVIRTNDFIPVYEALAGIKRKFPAKLLRQMKEQLYQLVITNDPRAQIYVQDIDEETSTSSIEFVIGVGAIAKMSKIGYKGVKSEHLFADLITDENRYNPIDVVSIALPELLKRNKYVPIYKYLRSAGYLDGKRSLDELDSRLKKALQLNEKKFEPPKQYLKNREMIQGLNLGVDGIKQKYDLTKAMNYILLLPFDEIVIDELESFLRKNIDLLEYSSVISNFDTTSFRRLACLYDWLCFKA